MATLTYLLPLTPTDNNHVSQVDILPTVIDCFLPEINPNPPRCLPCEPLVTLPFIEDDILYFQFRLSTPVAFAQYTFFTPDGTPFGIPIVIPVTPVQTDNGWVHTILIAVPLLEDGFYVKVEIGSVIHYSGIYCREICQETVLLEGVYPKTDCSGFNYEGTYRNILRMRGIFMKTGFSVNVETTANHRRVQSETVQTYLLNLDVFSTFTELQLERIFAAKRLVINGIDYEFSGDVTKNLDLTKHWASNIEITLTKCKTTFNC